jgi:peptidoglycan hydrolase-like protein with peptidoglycan-binding domain
MVRQPGAAVADSKRLYVVGASAHPGSRGTGVRALQRRLKDLGYVTPINGHYGGSTARAVLAFRKVNGFSRTTSAGRTVFRRLARGGGGFKARYPKAGKHVEFDWSRQVLALLRGSRPQIVLHTSSGAPSTPTVFGKYRFYRKHPGYNAKGMYYSVYFVGGYAIHGFSPVPTYPASHGCLRIPIPTAKRVYGWVSLGDPIYTYR